MSKQKNIPELQFPEFTGEWEGKELGEISEIKTGDKDTQNRVDDGTYPFFVRSDTVERINSYSYDGEAILTSGDGVGVGKNFHYINGKFDFHQRVYSIRKFNRNYSGKFIYYIFSERFYKHVIRLSAKNSVDSVRMDMIKDMSILFPKFPEQQKIASFFTTIDQKISQLKQKKNLLEQYKKGVMQKIFSQEVRFRPALSEVEGDENGQEFPKWEEKRLGEISDRNQKKNKKNTETSVLTNSAVNGIVLQSDYFDKDIANQNNLLNYYIVEVDDFVYNPRISVHAPVGPIKRNHIGVGVMSPLYSVFRFTEGILEFFEYYLSTTYWHEYMKSIANYGARSDRMNITTKDLYSMPIPFPLIEEQTKIANFLSAIDAKINHTQTQIEKAELWKKGLLQKMFV